MERRFNRGSETKTERWFHGEDTINPPISVAGQHLYGKLRVVPAEKNTA